MPPGLQVLLSRAVTRLVVPTTGHTVRTVSAAVEGCFHGITMHSSAPSRLFPKPDNTAEWVRLNKTV